ncbi:hypothetical protein SMKI_07G2330 [Saccharomyces mikatae IFO 1815]|uniref:Uncharacterized protein n=1 Tax=Saccharomyces mikatae IFO 1815 TaxID=226126 RepID=A0AA35IYH0_SACMI|nr:uncharacterized protein SMKI_07G2330 [Saccharomyces mikatae IFO 1815]CAI4039253.1 hypothetical protein SMKI_07G2330 [Saccharomyces mikatae IFO 1815]
MKNVTRPLYYSNTETRPLSLPETTNNLKSSLKKFSQKAKTSPIPISRERIHHFRKWKNKKESLPDVNFLRSENFAQNRALPVDLFFSSRNQDMYWNQDQFQLEVEILEYLSLNTDNEYSISNN